MKLGRTTFRTVPEVLNDEFDAATLKRRSDKIEDFLSSDECRQQIAEALENDAQDMTLEIDDSTGECLISITYTK